MKIKQIEIYKLSIKLKEPFTTSLGSQDHARNIIVVIRTDTGITGFGECSPYMTINGESIDTCFIVGQYFAKIFIGTDPLKIEAWSSAMDTLIYGNSSIKSAFDMALYDIAAQHADQPLYAFLGGNKSKILQTDYTVSLGEPEKMADDARRIIENGFQIIKVKLGDSKEKDVERIRLIREAVGNLVLLRIDANQGWSTSDALEILKALKPYNIQYCEEPIARWNFMELPEIKRQSPIPIMADESCGNHHDAKRLIGLSSCDLFNVKLGKAPGIFIAQKIIRLAEQAGIKIQIGGFLESRLGFTAAAHLAFTSDSIIHYDMDTPLMFAEDPIAGGLAYNEKGVITVPDKAGLGATISEKYLQGLIKVVIN